MPKINLPTISSGYLSTEALNQAFADIEAAFDNTLSRDGSTPNQMAADLDLNGHRLVNSSADPNDPDSIPTFQDVQDYIDDRASGLVVQRLETLTATAAQTVFDFSSISYDLGSNNLAVYVNGVRKFTPTYAETDVNTITFAVGLSAGDKVVGITNEFLATVELPTHTHPWNQITNLPDYTTRWPTWDEVTGKPSTFTPATHTHSASDITTGRLADPRRGVWVQSSQPTAGSVGELWFW